MHNAVLFRVKVLQLVSKYMYFRFNFCYSRIYKAKFLLIEYLLYSNSLTWANMWLSLCTETALKRYLDAVGGEASPVAVKIQYKIHFVSVVSERNECMHIDVMKLIKK